MNFKIKGKLTAILVIVSVMLATCISCTQNTNTHTTTSSQTQTSSTTKTFEPSPSNLKKPSAAGALQIKDKDGVKTVCDSKGDPIQLRGMSTHGLQWFGDIINTNAFAALSNDWGANVVRISMYVGENGYASDPSLKDKVAEAIKLAKDNDLYAIVDWHVLTPGDPTNEVYSGATDFFKYISEKYPNDPNVIYELCNEPNQNNDGIPNDKTGWQKVKAYAEPIIKMLRDSGNKNLIIVGNPCWSQRPDLAADDPIKDDNVSYTVHFYSGTHKPSDNDTDRSNVMSNTRYALAHGVSVFASEWGDSNADGSGGPFFDDAETWLKYLDDNNISWCNWSFSNADESSAALGSYSLGPGKTASLDPGDSQKWPLDKLSLSGRFVRAHIKGIPADKE